MGEEIAKMIWAPVMRSHRVTVEQMAMLEPALAETVCASLLEVMREGVDEVARRGVDRQAALRFSARPHQRAGLGDFQARRGRFFGCLQQGHRVRQAGADARRLEAHLRA